MANAEPGAVEAPTVKLEHVTAAIVGREKASRQADIQKLQKIWEKKGEAEMFAAEGEEPIGEKQPNFPEIFSVLDNVADTNRKQILKDKATIMQEIVEKKTPLSADAHVKAIADVIVTMPGMVVSIAKETGLTIEQVKTQIEQPNFSRTSPIGKIIEGRILKDEKFMQMLRKNIGENLEKPDTLVQLDEEIRSKQSTYDSTKANIDSQRSLYKNNGAGSFDKIDAIRSTTPAAFNDLKAKVDLFNNATLSLSNNSILKELGVPTVVTSAGDAESLIGIINRQLVGLSDSSMSSITDNIPRRTKKSDGTWDDDLPNPDNRTKLMDLKELGMKLQRLKELVGDSAFLENMRHYNAYNEYVTKTKGELDGNQATNDALKLDIAIKRSARDKSVNMIAQRVDRMMNKSVKDYYNSVILTEADKIAHAEAQKKIDDKAEAKTLAEKREKASEQILDKLKLTFIKYQGGKPVGWDDAALKDFVKKDMLSHSPADMAKKLLERVMTKRGSMPPEYKKEIDDLLKDVGVGAGPPPVTARDIINGISRDKYKEWAKKIVPDTLGYAWGRGYYFDRLHLKPAQAEFMQRAYGGENGVDFFTDALTAKIQYAGETETLLGADFMDGGVVSREKIKNMLVGKDWVQGSKKLMKAVAIAGAGYVLGGGLAWGLDSAGLALGAKQVGANLNAAKLVGQNALIGISKLGNVALHNTLGNATTAGMDSAAMAAHNLDISSQLTAGSITAEQAAKLTLDTKVAGIEQSGGLLQKIAEATRSSSGLNVNGPKP